jgi:hypothetical protein
VTQPEPAGVVLQPVSVASWAITGFRPSRIASRPEACGPGMPGSFEVAVLGLAAQAGEGVQSGFAKSSIWPSVVFEIGSPAALFTRCVTITAYSVFSLSGGSMNGGTPTMPGSAGTAGCNPITREKPPDWICGGSAT